SDPTNTGMPELTFAATSSTANWVVNFDGSSYLTFKGLKFNATGSTYARAIVLSSGGNSNLVFEGDSIISESFSSSSNDAGVYSSLTSGTQNTDLTFRKNYIKGGYYGLYLYGGSAARGSNIVLDSNEIF